MFHTAGLAVAVTFRDIFACAGMLKKNSLDMKTKQ